jgi:hypothetical protein
MRAMGLGDREIAAEFARRHRFRLRAGRREAHGWSLKKAGARINAHSGKVGLDSGGIPDLDADAERQLRRLLAAHRPCEPRTRLVWQSSAARTMAVQTGAPSTAPVAGNRHAGLR